MGIIFLYQKINSEPPATTKMNDIGDVCKYKQTTLTNGRIRKYKRTDGQTDERMTATNAIGECY